MEKGSNNKKHMIVRDEKLEYLPNYEDAEEPKDRNKQPAIEKKIGLSLKKEQDLNKTQTETRKDNKPEN